MSRLWWSLLCIFIYFRQVAQQRVAYCEEARLSWHFLVFSVGGVGEDGKSQPDSSHSLKLHWLKLPVRSGTKLLGVYTLGRNTHEPALHPSPRLSLFFLLLSFFLIFIPRLLPPFHTPLSAGRMQRKCCHKCFDTFPCIIYIGKNIEQN